MKENCGYKDSDLKRGYSNETEQPEFRNPDSWMHEYDERKAEREAGGFIERKNQHERI